ncbi:16S rRNA (guanine(966)-N(2))-methyltransferase RsmD [Labedella phragmitis]|uniref:16S rRNA (Guanine(966)-N(2))-methyltransferase RsmD n=1 Tax=Labedella phragmitis TaxID=2498849 RepID=A0A444PVS4_9MICO|nr:16S rRNA (guanine(966)-N(2))-methyltransferase RsmD [Labedella phragmitis]RWZ51984.1 16S rRNA (guanine(966)-N(2))-methyltransferase RsmD [Labedella phragmitis]
MTRIIAGRARSVRLSVPRSGTRPTSERVREAIFSSLDSWDAIAGARVLDLYAGSGALGLEAASRGASSVVLVERNPKAAALCRANAAAVQRAIGGEATIAVAPHAVRSYLSSLASPVDLVLVDPPYDLGEDDLEHDLDAIARNLADDGVLVVERSSRSPEPRWPDGIRLLRSRDYGETRVWFAGADTGDDDAATSGGGPARPAV